jgi:hypothetical protein
LSEKYCLENDLEQDGSLKRDRILSPQSRLAVKVFYRDSIITTDGSTFQFQENWEREREIERKERKENKLKR